MLIILISFNIFRRAPHGARGLKFASDDDRQLAEKSRPARGAWIEIRTILEERRKRESRPARGAWIEII